MASYKIAALVVGKESYSYGWNAKISPIDLALAWGKLADPESQKYVSYSQSNRWVSFKMKEGSPFDVAYVISHASNHHIIPATRNIWYAVKTIKEKKKVVLEGFLVNVCRDLRWENGLVEYELYPAPIAAMVLAKFYMSPKRESVTGFMNNDPCHPNRDLETILNQVQARLSISFFIFLYFISSIIC